MMKHTAIYVGALLLALGAQAVGQVGKFNECQGTAANVVCGPTGVPATGQTTSYGTGSDGNLQAGRARSFTDNGDGTITDNLTGLMWEKKQNLDTSFVECANETGSCANPHDADNLYEWCADDTPEDSSCDNPGNPYDGAVVSIFLNQLNNRCNKDVTVPCATDANCRGPGGPCGFAGHRDWRLPNQNELLSLVNYQAVNPAAFSAFNTGCSASCALTTPGSCSCTGPNYFWSSSTYQANPVYAWDVNFYVGYVDASTKYNGLCARAVRAAFEAQPQARSEAGR